MKWWRYQGYDNIGNFLDSIESKWLRAFVGFPFDLYTTLDTYCQNRFISRIHILDTKFPKGVYYEIEDRMLHGLFNTFIDFVENEKDGMAEILKSRKTYEEANMHSHLQMLNDWERLYSFWKNRPLRKSVSDFENSYAGYQEYEKLEKQYKAEDDEMLLLLINNRRTLWS